MEKTPITHITSISGLNNPTKRDNSEEWKLVKGTGTLPVKFNYSYEKQSKDNDGNNVMETVNKSLEINGTIEF